MVKTLDEKTCASEPPSHLGWDLHRANEAWRRHFVREMVAAGHAWFGEARAGLIPHIGRKGMAQSMLSELTGLTKQAIQQQLDDLVRDGIAERVCDSSDSRRKLVRLTAIGLRMVADGDLVKQQIEARAAEALGTDQLERLRKDLNSLEAILL